MSYVSLRWTLACSRSAALARIVTAVAVLGVPSVLASQTNCGRLEVPERELGVDAQLGWSVDAEGDWLAAGANMDEGKGSIILFRKLKFERKEAPPDLKTGDQFGFSVSISDKWLAVGAPLGDGSIQDSGVVYLFELAGSSWGFVRKLEADDAARHDEFGYSVSLSQNTLVVGARGDSDRGSHSGSAYVFELRAGSWSQTAELHASDAFPFDNFGSSVAIAEDPEVLVVGAPFADDPIQHRNFGAAYVFIRDGSVPEGWVQENNGKLNADDTFRPDNIQFGAAVAIGKGRIVVGAPGDDVQGRTDSGSAYVFMRKGNGSGWARLGLFPENSTPGKQFGAAARIDPKGENVVIGAPFDGAGGAVYNFAGQVSVQPPRFVRDVQKAAFGRSVAVLDQVVVAGAYRESGKGAVIACPPSPPEAQVDLVLKAQGPESVSPEGSLTYMLTVKNKGPNTATNVTLEQVFPGELPQFVGSTPPSDCKTAGGKFSCELGTLAPDQRIAVSFEFKVLESCFSIIENQIKVSANEEDRDSSNNEFTVEIPRIVDLALEKTGPSFVKPGGSIAYTLKVTNRGPNSACDVRLVDTIPAGLLLPVSLPSCKVQANAVTCRMGVLHTGESRAVPLSLAVPPAALCGSTIVNTASVTDASLTIESASSTTMSTIVCDGLSPAEIPALGLPGLVALALLLAVLAPLRLRHRSP